MGGAGPADPAVGKKRGSSFTSDPPRWAQVHTKIMKKMASVIIKTYYMHQYFKIMKMEMRKADFTPSVCARLPLSPATSSATR